MGIYFFYGDEDYLIDKELERYKNKLDKNFLEMSYSEFDRLTFGELISTLRSQPMMFGEKMIVINTANLLSGENSTKRQSLLNASLDDSQINEIENSLENNNEQVNIFFVERYSKDDKVKKPDSRRKIYKVLSKYNKQEFMSIPGWDKNKLSEWINRMAKEKKIKIASDAVTALIEKKGNDLRAFDTELDKLELLAYPEKTITKKMVDEMCISNEDLFNLTDYIMTGDYGKALLEIRQLLVNKHPLEILVPLQTMLKTWIFMKLNQKTMSYKEIGEKLGRMHEYRVKLALEQMKNTPLKDLVALRERLSKAEYKIKTGLCYNPTEEFENAVIG